MWSDNETVSDLFGFRIHADLIRNVVTDVSLLPTTVGVFGDWGGGKSSLMRMLQRDLNPENWPEGTVFRTDYQDIAVVYINTWLNEGYDDAKAAILTSVLLELKAHKRFGPKLRDAAQSLLGKVNLMRLAGMAIRYIALPATVAFLTGGLAAVPAAVAISTGLSAVLPGGKETSESPSEEGPPKPEWNQVIAQGSGGEKWVDVRGFRQEFGKMLRDSGIRILVILVDDLDRCTPERIVENLEAVKLFLSAEQSAFVIGADPRIVEHAIRLRYANVAADSSIDGPTIVKDYLEKLVQVPYTLPRLSAGEIQSYMTLLFCQRYLGADQYERCLKACDEARAANRYETFGEAGVRAALGKEAPPAELTGGLALSAAAAPLIADGLKGNPRQVKRFLNALVLRKQLAKAASIGGIRDDVLIKLMILEYVQTDLFTQLFAWQTTDNGHPKQLAEMEALVTADDAAYEEAAKGFSGKWATTAARRWLAMEPPLKEVDLRDYFWVARDRLQSTFAGVTLVSPLVRALFADLVSEVAPRRNEAAKGATLLPEDERDSLLSLLEQSAVRNPSEKKGFDALRYLVENDTRGAAETLGRVLTRCPLEKVPAAVGMDLGNLVNAKPGIAVALSAAVERIRNSESRVGKAFQRSNRKTG